MKLSYLFSYLFCKNQKSSNKVIHFIYSTFQFRPKKNQLYELAFTHPSANETNSIRSVDNYERLEFLGDAILNLIVSQYLFQLFPKQREGGLSQIKSKIVSRESLTKLAELLQFSAYIKHNIRDVSKASYVAGNVLEAFVGAMYLDLGFQRTQNIVMKKLLIPNFKPANLMILEKDYKSLFYQYCQKKKLTIEYKVIKEQIVKGCKKFEVDLYVSDIFVAKAEDRSKKKAEQKASELAYSKILEPNFIGF